MEAPIPLGGTRGKYRVQAVLSESPILIISVTSNPGITMQQTEVWIPRDTDQRRSSVLRREPKVDNLLSALGTLLQDNVRPIEIRLIRGPARTMR
jgi:hypothetical protein